MIHRFDRFVDIFVEPDREVLQGVASAKGLRWSDPGAWIEPPQPIKILEVESRSVSEEIVRGGLDGLTGKGILFRVLSTFGTRPLPGTVSVSLLPLPTREAIP